VRLTAYDFTSQEHVRLRMYFVSAAGLRKPERVVLNIAGQASRLSRPAPKARDGMNDPSKTEAISPFGDRRDACPTLTEWLSTMRHAFAAELAEELKLTGLEPRADPTAEGGRSFIALEAWLQTNRVVLACVAPRGFGLTAWSPNERKQVQIRRRFMLLGQTVDGMRVWDIRRALQAVGSMPEWGNAPLEMRAEMGFSGVRSQPFGPGGAGVAGGMNFGGRNLECQFDFCVQRPTIRFS